MSDSDKNPPTNGTSGEGRDTKGRFVQGNKLGRGNPLCKQVAAWRATLAGVVTTEDVADVIGVLTGAAKKGEPWAVVEFLNRTLGKPGSYVDTDSGAMPTADFLRQQLYLMNASVSGGHDQTNEEDGEC